MFENFFNIDESISNIVISNNELKAIYLYDFFIKTKKSLLVVANTLFEANKIYHDIANYTDNILFFPMDDFLTSEALAISPELEITRLETLNELTKNNNKIVVTNLMGFLRYLPKKSLYLNKILTIKKGGIIDSKNLLSIFSELGYKKEVTVTKTGEMAIRGYVIDIFPIDSINPIRLELWGDDIETIKTFDVNTQLTIEEIDEFTIKPITEFLANSEEKKQRLLPNLIEVDNIFGYLDNANLCYLNTDELNQAYEQLVREMMDYSKSIEIPADTKYMFDLNDFVLKNSIFIDEFNSERELKESSIEIQGQDINLYKISLSDLKEELDKYLKSNKTVILCLSDKKVLTKVYDALEDSKMIITNEFDIKENKVNLIIKNITNGFIYDKYVVLGEKELLNKKEEQGKYKTSFTVGTKIRDINKLEIGDYIVHYKYGIGRYMGLKILKKGDLTKEYLMLEYANTDKLYIPVEKIELIKKYSNSDASPKLNKLNSAEWQKTKAKAAKKIEDIAGELLKLYAIRESTEGFAFEKDDENQLEFEREFKYTETSDQLKVIKEIKKDMERKVPMDRLLCGDVGFGKTEVAFRAIFKAVLSKKQVVFLCPTTILSQQHYDNALERFKAFPVKIALLNRFVSPKNAEEIIDEVNSGKVDILIGTHKALSSDILFKDLGLMVIDEEQRFGVKHKEKIKKYKNNIDVLTLSATPIPRTLQMSLSGLRNLSLIETPPTNRYPVQTYVLEENIQIIKDAVYKELSRNGQVYILSNRVDGMEEKVAFLRQNIKDVRINYAHGQMSKKELEDVMNSFINKEFDVLLCTTIIEIGIDIPSVNTIIILDSDRFGLSQLYQIRGRVGRSNKIAYCYLMYDKRKVLSEVANKRLKVIKEFTELGSGFAIAMRDLSIRGAGDILGSEQAGFVDAIGIEYFLEMLSNEVERLKGNVKEEEPISDQPLLDVSTSIDDNIVSDGDLKIEIHKKINTIDSYEKLIEVKNEIKDRFGLVDETLDVYMYEEWFEKYARKLKINDVLQTKNSIIIGLPKEMYAKIDGKKLFMDVNRLGNMYRFSENNGKLMITLDIVSLKRHFVYHLIDLLKVIENSLKV